MEYPAGTTFVSEHENNMTGYKILVEPFMLFFTREQVYYHDSASNTWIRSFYSRSDLKLVKLNS